MREILPYPKIKFGRFISGKKAVTVTVATTGANPRREVAVDAGAKWHGERWVLLRRDESG